MRSVSNTTDTAVDVLCVLLFLPNNFTIIIKVIKIALPTGAITGYYKVFATCKLLERSEKNGRLKKLSNKKRKRNCLNPDLYVLFCNGPYLPGEHISLVICVPLPETHISLVICVPPPGKYVSLVICVSLLLNFISLVICVDMCSLTWKTHIPCGMFFPAGEHISLLILVFLVICVFLPAQHISIVICFSLPRKHISIVT